jgi:peptide/nickel transport system substrate-binding protein
MLAPQPDGNQLAPNLATAWTTTPDGLKWTFTIRKGVKFHDGEDFNASAMKAHIDRYIAGKGLGAGDLRNVVASTSAPDDTTLVIDLKGANPALLSDLNLTTRAGFPAPPQLAATGGNDALKAKPTGTGPFVTSEFKRPEQLLTMEAFEGHWSRVPYVKTVVYRYVPDSATAMAMLKTQELDVLELAGKAQIDQVKADSKLKLTLVPSAGTIWFMMFDQSKPGSPYNNVLVRKAINYAVDKQTIIDNVLGGAGEVSGSVANPFQYGYNPDVKPYPYDPEKAKQFLKEAGYANGFDGGDLVAAGSATAVHEAIQSYLGAVGIKTKINIYEPSAWGANYRERKFTNGMGNSGSSLGGDAAYRLVTFLTKGGQYSFVDDPDIEALYMQQKTENNPGKRLALLQKGLQMANERAEQLFLWNPKIAFGLGPRIASWTPIKGQGLFINTESVKLAQ